MADKERKYVPSFVAHSDDMVLTDEDGNEQHPHAGEWVRFRKGVKMSVMRLVARATGLHDLPDDATPEQQAEMGAEYVEVSEGIIRAIRGQVLDWNWTDEDWEPMPRPADSEAFTETLWNLADYEIAWLQQHMSDGASVPKN